MIKFSRTSEANGEGRGFGVEEVTKIRPNADHLPPLSVLKKTWLSWVSQLILKLPFIGVPAAYSCLLLLLLLVVAEGKKRERKREGGTCHTL